MAIGLFLLNYGWLLAGITVIWLYAFGVFDWLENKKVGGKNKAR
jgi:hypothetical protein